VTNNMESVLITLAWLFVSALVVASAAFFVLKWAAFRIARRVAEATERRVAASLAKGFARTGVRFSGTQDEALRAKYLGQIDRLAQYMDRLVPLPVVGGIGLDAVLGVVPVVGDAISMGISSLIVIRAAQLGVPTELLSRLIAIQCVDMVLGAVPVVGDVIDVAYKGDIRCVGLIKEFVNSQRDAITIK
jgi:hypothetical protein